MVIVSGGSSSEESGAVPREYYSKKDNIFYVSCENSEFYI